jgi:hypothetical protein
MKYIKIIIGGLLAISGFLQLLKVISLYLILPFEQWPLGAEIGTIAITIAGIFIFINGLKHNNEKAKPINE